MIIFENSNILCTVDPNYCVDNYFTIDVLIAIDDFKGKTSFCISLEEITAFISKSKDV